MGNILKSIEKAGKKAGRQVVSGAEKYGKEARRATKDGKWRAVVNPAMYAHGEYLRKHPDSFYSKKWDEGLGEKVDPLYQKQGGGAEESAARIEARNPLPEAPAPLAQGTAGIGERDSMLDRYGRRRTKVASTRMRSPLGGK